MGSRCSLPMAGQDIDFLRFTAQSSLVAAFISLKVCALYFTIKLVNTFSPSFSVPPFFFASNEQYSKM